MAVILFEIKCIQDKWSFIKHSDSNQSRQIPEKEKTSFLWKRGRNAGFGIYPPLVRCSLEQRRKPLSRKTTYWQRQIFLSSAKICRRYSALEPSRTEPLSASLRTIVFNRLKSFIMSTTPPAASQSVQVTPSTRMI